MDDSCHTNECIGKFFGMGWLRLVGSFKLQVSCAEYRLVYSALLQKRPVILRSLLIVATPYHSRGQQACTTMCDNIYINIHIYTYTYIHTYIHIYISKNFPMHSCDATSLHMCDMTPLHMCDMNPVHIYDMTPLLCLLINFPVHSRDATPRHMSRHMNA